MSLEMVSVGTAVAQEDVAYLTVKGMIADV